MGKEAKYAVWLSAARQVVLADFLRSVYPLPESDASRRTQNSYGRRIEKIVARITREREQTSRADNRWQIATQVSAWDASESWQCRRDYWCNPSVG
jgi:hypothetical protein